MAPSGGLSGHGSPRGHRGRGRAAPQRPPRARGGRWGAARPRPRCPRGLPRPRPRPPLGATISRDRRPTAATQGQRHARRGRGQRFAPQPIATTRERLDHTRRRRRGVEGGADMAHGVVDPGLEVHVGAVGPQAAGNLGVGHERPGALRQQRQQRGRLRLEATDVIAAAHVAARRVEGLAVDEVDAGHDTALDGGGRARVRPGRRRRANEKGRAPPGARPSSDVLRRRRAAAPTSTAAPSPCTRRSPARPRTACPVQVGHQAVPPEPRRRRPRRRACRSSCRWRTGAACCRPSDRSRSSSVGVAIIAAWPRRPQLVSTFHALEQRVVAERVLLLLRHVAVRNHPEMLAGVHVDGDDAPTGPLKIPGCRAAGSSGRHRRCRRPWRCRGLGTQRRDVLPAIFGVVALLRGHHLQPAATARRRDEDDAGDRIGGGRTGDVRAAPPPGQMWAGPAPSALPRCVGGAKNGASASVRCARSSASFRISGV